MKSKIAAVITLFACLLFTCFAGDSFAQQLHFTQISGTGLPTDGTVLKIFKDSRGYIWFLSNKGIARSDGKNTHLFGKDEGYNEEGAYQIVEDSFGNLWVVTINFRLYVFSKGKFRMVSANQKICWISFDGIGTLTAVSRETGLRFGVYECNPSDLSIKYIQEQSGGDPFHIMKTPEGKYLVSVIEGVVEVSGTVRKQLIDELTYQTTVVKRIFNVNGKIFISASNGLSEYKKGQLNRCFLQGNLEYYEVLYFSLTREYWLFTSDGIIITDLNFNKKSNLFRKSAVLSGALMDNNTVVVSTESGIYRCNIQSKHYTLENDLDFPSVSNVAAESNRLYFFYDDRSFYERKSDGSLIKRFFDTDWMSKRVMVKNISDTDIYIYGHRWVFGLTGGKLARRNSNYLCAPAYIRAKGNIFHTNSNVALDDSTNIVITRKQQDELGAILNKRSINLIYYPPLAFEKGYVYYSSSVGLLRVKFASSGIDIHIIKETGLVKSIFFEGDDLYVITEAEGVKLLSKGKWRSFNEKNYLLSNYCSDAILKDSNLWILTSGGLSCVNIYSNRTRNYTDKDYLLSNQINSICFYQNKLYVATDKGVSVFTPPQYHSSNIPSINLESVLINNKYSDNSEQYQTSYLENNFTINVSSPGMRSADFNKFRVLVISDDRVDTFMYKDGNIPLFALMPGEYTVQIDVINIDHNMSIKPVLINILISPPFWKTWWFMCIIILFISGVSGYLIWLSLKRQREMQEYKRKLSESELKSLRLYMNPHFLFNSLTSLQSFILTVKTEDANKFITKFSKLIRSVMTYSVRGELKLTEEIALLKSYLELESVRFGEDFTYQVFCADNIDADAVIIPSLIIQPFVENCVKHGVTGITGRISYIKVVFEMRDDELYCIVADNGKGRQEKKQGDKIHVSSGIKFTEERIRLMINAPERKVIDIEDTDTGSEFPGTTVTVLVPVLNKDNNHD